MGPVSWTILIVLVLICGGLIFAAIRHNQKEEQARANNRQRREDERAAAMTCSDLLGAPIFDDRDPSNGKRQPVGSLDVGDGVWCITPYGVMRGEIQEDGGDQIVIDCGEYVVHGQFVPEFFSESMAQRLGIGRSAWIVSDLQHVGWGEITYHKGQGRVHRPSITQKTGATWLRDYSIFGDFTDIMVDLLWYELMFGGFEHDVEYYDTLEPVVENGEVINWTTEEERAAEVSSFESTQAEIEEAAARVAETGEPEVTATQDPGDSTSFFTSSDESSFRSPDPSPPPEPETKRYDPPPTYAPPEPSYEPPADSGGGGYDSGDSGGGGFDD